jgi:predicted phosphoribosyltransferase
MMFGGRAEAGRRLAERLLRPKDGEPVGGARVAAQP